MGGDGTAEKYEAALRRIEAEAIGARIRRMASEALEDSEPVALSLCDRYPEWARYPSTFLVGGLVGVGVGVVAGIINVF